MKSFDTNILLYGVNRDCPEYQQANLAIHQALQEPTEWIIADQVYFELYRLLRNRAVLEYPVSANDAFNTVSFFRNRSGWLHCSYETPFWKETGQWMKKDSFQARNVLDLKLAVTLKKNGVETLYTRNIDDFQDLDYFALIDPIESS